MDVCANQQYLVNSGSVLKDERTLKYYNIENEDRLFLVRRSITNDSSVLPTYCITVFIRPLAFECKVRVASHATVRELIEAICEESEKLRSPDQY